MTTAKVEALLNLSGQTKAELGDIKKLDFNVFAVRESTNNNELVTVISYILAQQGIFQELTIVYKVFQNFMRTI